LLIFLSIFISTFFLVFFIVLNLFQCYFVPRSLIILEGNYPLLLQIDYIVQVSSQVSPLFAWHIYQEIVDCLFLVVIPCVLNWFGAHWLFSGVLNFIV